MVELCMQKFSTHAPLMKTTPILDLSLARMVQHSPSGYMPVHVVDVISSTRVVIQISCMRMTTNTLRVQILTLFRNDHPTNTMYDPI